MPVSCYFTRMFPPCLLPSRPHTGSLIYLLVNSFLYFIVWHQACPPVLHPSIFSVCLLLFFFLICLMIPCISNPSEVSPFSYLIFLILKSYFQRFLNVSFRESTEGHRDFIPVVSIFYLITVEHLFAKVLLPHPNKSILQGSVY